MEAQHIVEDTDFELHMALVENTAVGIVEGIQQGKSSLDILHYMVFGMVYLLEEVPWVEMHSRMQNRKEHKHQDSFRNMFAKQLGLQLFAGKRHYFLDFISKFCCKAKTERAMQKDASSKLPVDTNILGKLH